MDVSDFAKVLRELRTQRKGQVNSERGSQKQNAQKFWRKQDVDATSVEEPSTPTIGKPTMSWRTRQVANTRWTTILRLMPFVTITDGITTQRNLSGF